MKVALVDCGPCCVAVYSVLGVCFVRKQRKCGVGHPEDYDLYYMEGFAIIGKRKGKLQIFGTVEKNTLDLGNKFHRLFLCEIKRRMRD